MFSKPPQVILGPSNHLASLPICPPCPHPTSLSSTVDQIQCEILYGCVVRRHIRLPQCCKRLWVHIEKCRVFSFCLETSKSGAAWGLHTFLGTKIQWAGRVPPLPTPPPHLLMLATWHLIKDAYFDPSLPGNCSSCELQLTPNIVSTGQQCFFKSYLD